MLAARPSPRWLLGKPLHRSPSRGPCPRSSSASPSPSGPEVANPWDATITKVVERSHDRTLVRTRRLDD